MIRVLAPAAVCAGLTLLALTADLGPLITAALVVVLIFSPAVTAWPATRGRDPLTYVAAGVLAGAAVALVGAVSNESADSDYPLGVVFAGTLIVGLMFTLPPVLLAALFRR